MQATLRSHERTPGSHWDASRARPERRNLLAFRRSGNEPTMNETDDWSERLGRWDEARKRLRLRVYPDAWVAEQARKVIARSDYPGLQAVAVLDLPKAVAVAAFEHLECWDKTSDEVLAIAGMNSLEEATESESSYGDR